LVVALRYRVAYSLEHQNKVVRKVKTLSPHVVDRCL